MHVYAETLCQRDLFYNIAWGCCRAGRRTAVWFVPIAVSVGFAPADWLPRPSDSDAVAFLLRCSVWISPTSCWNRKGPVRTALAPKMMTSVAPWCLRWARTQIWNLHKRSFVSLFVLEKDWEGYVWDKCFSPVILLNIEARIYSLSHPLSHTSSNLEELMIELFVSIGSRVCQISAWAQMALRPWNEMVICHVVDQMHQGLTGFSHENIHFSGTEMNDQRWLLEFLSLKCLFM